MVSGADAVAPAGAGADRAGAPAVSAVAVRLWRASGAAGAGDDPRVATPRPIPVPTAAVRANPTKKRGDAEGRITAMVLSGRARRVRVTRCCPARNGRRPATPPI